jgi:hypothetical protein
MTRTSTTFFRLSVATVLASAALLWSGQVTLDHSHSLVSSAEARIGRPLTPLSYAGVARRTTRRAVAVGVAAGAAYAAPVVVAPACAQTVDVYGRVVTVCR